MWRYLVRACFVGLCLAIAAARTSGAWAFPSAFLRSVAPVAFEVSPIADDLFGALPSPKDLKMSAGRLREGSPWSFPLTDRQLSAAEKAESLAPDLTDAVLRMEGLFDPTRTAPLGAVPPMRVRPGTASMNNVFGDRWSRADPDPNLHFRVKYLAYAWLRPMLDKTSCTSYERVRPLDSVLTLDMPSRADCARLAGEGGPGAAAPTVAAIVAAPLDVPAFAAPYPGTRLSRDDIRIALESRAKAARERLWFRGNRSGGVQP